ncbi:MAG: hypothetical protein U0T84_02160 [Chitinophagales bacterium]
MKQLLAICVFTCFGISTNAQDTLRLLNGNTILAKVSEVNIDNIKYRRFDVQDGPVYTVRKSEIKSICYGNGVCDEFNKSGGSSSEVQIIRFESNTVTDSARYMRYYREDLRKGIALTVIGPTFLVAGASLLAVGVTRNIANGNTFEDPDPINIGLIVSGSLLAAAGIPLTIAGPVKIHSARTYRNLALKGTTGSFFEFRPGMVNSSVAHTELAFGGKLVLHF